MNKRYYNPFTGEYFDIPVKSGKDGYLTYFQPYVDDLGLVHSIDKCSITYVLIKQSESIYDYILEYFDKICNEYALFPEKKYYNVPRSALGWSKHFYKFRPGVVAFIGFYNFNRGKRDFDLYHYVRMEFNPNKQICIDNLVCDISKFLCSISVSADIRRIDYAVDVRLPIDDIIVPVSLKTKQIYDTTRYFGVPGSQGRLKIYDKAKESNLDYILTRIEYTFKKNKDINFEKIYILNRGDSMSESLSSNSRVICRLCLALKSAGFDYTEFLRELNARKRKTVIEAIEGTGQLIIQDTSLVNFLVFQLQDKLKLDCSESNRVVSSPIGFSALDDFDNCEQMTISLDD